MENTQPNLELPKNSLDITKKQLEAAMAEAVELTGKVHELEEKIEKIKTDTSFTDQSLIKRPDQEQALEEAFHELKAYKRNLEEKWKEIGKLQEEYLQAGGEIEGDDELSSGPTLNA